jgi:four helix bundle protein
MEEQNNIRSFEDLVCWQKARELKHFVRGLCGQFPKSEQYLLTAQVKDASRSITANIAEGYGRFHFKENTQYCRQARGSLYELLDHMIEAFDENYITSEQLAAFKEKFEAAKAPLNGYINYLASRSKTKTKP